MNLRHPWIVFGYLAPEIIELASFKKWNHCPLLWLSIAVQSCNFVVVSYFIFVLSLRCGLFLLLSFLFFFDLEETCYYGGGKGTQERLQKINKEKRESGLFILMMIEKEGKERRYELNNKRKAENMCLYKLSFIFYVVIHCLLGALFDKELPLIFLFWSSCKLSSF